MCGFAGIYLFNKFNRSDYNKMSNELKFRGPDEFGEFIDIENQIAFFSSKTIYFRFNKKWKSAHGEFF